MIDSFYIGAYWGSRAESLYEIKDKVSQTFNRLMEIDEQFLNWYEGGMSRKKALEKKVTLNNETIERLCLQQVKKGELDEKGIAKMGFLLGLWTGHKDEESSRVSFTVGSSFTSPHLCNSCVVTIPFEGQARERLLRPEKAKAIIAIIVEIWNPDYAVLASNELNKALGIVNDIGWVTYRKAIRQMPIISSKVVYEKFGDGHLFYLDAVNYGYCDYDLANELLPIGKIIK